MENNFKITDRDAFAAAGIFEMGRGMTDTSGSFNGERFFCPVPVVGESPLAFANISFAPGVRNDWHTHTAKSGGGQLLICTAGEGWYMEEGKEPLSLTPGTIVYVAPGVKHWHGAKADSWFAHLCSNLPGEDTGCIWHGRFPDDEYAKL